MTESVSLAQMIETPFVCILAQRPGPATGLPTWTASGDLNVAIYGGHGEGPRCVIAISDGKSAYSLIQHAFNISEKFQIPVIVLTDKQIAESLFQVDDLPKDVQVIRSLPDAKILKKLNRHDRFKTTSSGISPRWFPGQTETTYVANSDEHLEDGSLTEEAQTSLAMNGKRLRKLDTLLKEIPGPQLYGPRDSSLTLVGWGSVKNTVLDIMESWNGKNAKNNINYLHFEYLYPLKLSNLRKLTAKKQPMVLVENNAFGQLGKQIAQESGFVFKDKLLKYDGRPFFIEDILDYLTERIKK